MVDIKNTEGEKLTEIELAVYMEAVTKVLNAIMKDNHGMVVQLSNEGKFIVHKLKGVIGVTSVNNEHFSEDVREFEDGRVVQFNFNKEEKSE